MIPQTLKIRGHVYKVRQVNRRELVPDSSGDIDTEQLLIQVYKRLPHARKVETVLHEALHGMLGGTGAKNEEAIVTILGEALLEFMRENPEFASQISKQS